MQRCATAPLSVLPSHLFHFCTRRKSKLPAHCLTPPASLWVFLMRGWAWAPFDISNLFGCSSRPPHLLRWPGGCLVGVGDEPMAGCRGVCLWRLLIADAVWYLGWSLICLFLRCCSCSDILKGSSVWAAVNDGSFLSLLLSPSICLTHFLIIQNETRVAGIWV